MNAWSEASEHIEVAVHVAEEHLEDLLHDPLGYVDEACLLALLRFDHGLATFDVLLDCKGCIFVD